MQLHCIGLWQYRDSLEENVAHVWNVLTKLMEHSLMAKSAKCALTCQKVNFFLFGSDKDGIHTKEYKTHAVRDWLQPDHSMDVRGILGFTSQHREFIKHYAQIAILLDTIGTLLNGTGGVGQGCGERRKVIHPPCTWDWECQHALDTLNMAHCDAALLGPAYPETKYRLHDDAS